MTPQTGGRSQEGSPPRLRSLLRNVRQWNCSVARSRINRHILNTIRHVDARFATTRWSVVLAAGHRTTGGRDSFASLCQSYWFPLYAYVRRRGYAPEDAQDLTQAFFTRLMEKNWVAAADQTICEALQFAHDARRRAPRHQAGEHPARPRRAA